MTSFKQSAEAVLRSKISYMDYLQVGHSAQDVIEAKEAAEEDIQEALEQLEALATKERHQAQLDLLEDLHDCKDIIKSEYERRTKILKELLDV